MTISTILAKHKLWVLQLCAQCVERGPANAEMGGLELDKASLLKLKSEAEASKATGVLQNMTLEDAVLDTSRGDGGALRR